MIIFFRYCWSNLINEGTKFISFLCNGVQFLKILQYKFYYILLKYVTTFLFDFLFEKDEYQKKINFHNRKKIYQLYIYIYSYEVDIFRVLWRNILNLSK